MNWDLLDFLVFGGMITVATTLLLLLRKKSRNPAYRFAAVIAILGAFLMIWVNGAVGIIGNEENEANFMFFGVLGVAFLGALIARFRASGMAKALFATAGAQVLVAVIAIVLDLGTSGPVWPKDILMITAFFSAFWLLSGTFFSKAARRERSIFAD